MKVTGADERCEVINFIEAIVVSQAGFGLNKSTSKRERIIEVRGVPSFDAEVDSFGFNVFIAESCEVKVDAVVVDGNGGFLWWGFKSIERREGDEGTG